VAGRESGRHPDDRAAARQLRRAVHGLPRGRSPAPALQLLRGGRGLDRSRGALGRRDGRRLRLLADRLPPRHEPLRRPVDHRLRVTLMPDGEPLIRNVSDTARWAAHYRALETERRDALFRDPLAARLAGERGRAIAKAMPRGANQAAFWVTR